MVYARAVIEWHLLRVSKFLALALWSAGIGGALLAGERRRRLAAAQWIATPGFLLTTAAGFGMARVQNVPLTQPWLAGSLLLGLLVLNLTLLAAERSSKDSRFLTAGIVLAGAATLALMVMRPEMTAP